MDGQPTCPLSISVRSEDFDIAAEIDRIGKNCREIGAIVTFTGLCRDEDGQLAALELEHYPGMAQAEISRMAKQAMERWPLNGLTVIHRYGLIKPGENIVLVVAASRHRHAAFEAASFLMDYMKTNAPFWKREHLADGTVGGWVSSKEEDEESRKRWEEPRKSE
ncbi:MULTISPECIES: molybdenum cofactor biosynthesis protein MoaE [unclassified Brucella]|uniref:molybdenum cofactor biosynthesis protein MoaE n=1 Tax=unclassified Brucella TaxID=2632610 RepID=UPI0012AE5CB5|nr:MULTISPECIES: molybdenum cofactor biosynthesis protein MoaE [unclassified Brucella]MRN42533.1 molybdopterin synthase catalytic subunit [Brucella sp. 09RB8913]MRN59844.1 molybdopterin synthase catalytic subunit [Brucella sp. 09RB8918]QTN98554.1 molybdenum cofactor biosynthesis protein MoaE [Brucella sp. 458]CAB4325899.1 molybdopterin biosynthesis protein MoaE [Brucella sp. 191011898]